MQARTSARTEESILFQKLHHVPTYTQQYGKGKKNIAAANRWCSHSHTAGDWTLFPRSAPTTDRMEKKLFFNPGGKNMFFCKKRETITRWNKNRAEIAGHCLYVRDAQKWRCMASNKTASDIEEGSRRIIIASHYGIKAAGRKGHSSPPTAALRINRQSEALSSCRVFFDSGRTRWNRPTTVLFVCYVQMASLELVLSRIKGESVALQIVGHFTGSIEAKWPRSGTWKERMSSSLSLSESSQNMKWLIVFEPND